MFGRFELKTALGSNIHLYNVHVIYEQNDPTKYLEKLDELLADTESRFGGSRLYPPVVLGDFNIGEADIVTHEPNFTIAGYAGREVMGVLVGNASEYPSKQNAHFQSLVAPVDVQDPAMEGLSSCGGSGVFWSDHCAVFVNFSPVAPN